MSKPHVILLYHYFHPDDVISARLYSDLATHLISQGYDVTAMPGNRSCHDDSVQYPSVESWLGTQIRRVWRPAWKQASNVGRLGNALFILMGWTWRAMWLSRRADETVIVGTDPTLGVLAAIAWRVLRQRIRIIHWCHDLYPHAAVADGIISSNSLLVRVLNGALRFAYRRCDVIADLGPCMRNLLVAAHGSRPYVVADDLSQEIDYTKFVTVTPWALVEPACVPSASPAVREQLFGNAQLGLLYSGNLGRAHSFELFLVLARELRDSSVALCFSGRGPRVAEMQQSLGSSDSNIRMAGFASEADLELRLSAADIHLVSLRTEWTGCVVPSKFFGALAIGRPVLFCGGQDAAIAQWIQRFQVGWVLHEDNVLQVASQLRNYLKDPAAKSRMNEHCLRAYAGQFSASRQMELVESLCKRP